MVKHGLWKTIIETPKQWTNVLFISTEDFVSEAATESSSGKKVFLKSMQNPWKIYVKKFIFSIVAGNFTKNEPLHMYFSRILPKF